MATAREGGEGWGFPPGSRKAHYFTSDGRSLCRRWGFAFALPLEPDNGKPSGDDCAPCRRALDARAKAAR